MPSPKRKPAAAATAMPKHLALSNAQAMAEAKRLQTQRKVEEAMPQKTEASRTGPHSHRPQINSNQKDPPMPKNMAPASSAEITEIRKKTLESMKAHEAAKLPQQANAARQNATKDFGVKFMQPRSQSGVKITMPISQMSSQIPRLEFQIPIPIYHIIVPILSDYHPNFHPYKCK